MREQYNYLKQYGRDITNFKRISDKEETKLAKRISKGDIVSRNKLVTANLKLVINIAGKYRDMGLEVEELICEGNKGLITAADKFDYKVGVKFGTYAYYWIREAILSAIKTKENVTYLGESKITANTNTTNRNNDDDFIDLDELRINNKFYVMYNNDEQEKEYEDKFEHMFNDVMIHIDKLTPRESDILKHYFGVNGCCEMNISELSNKYNVTNMRVSKIIDESIRKIRCNYLENSND